MGNVKKVRAKSPKAKGKTRVSLKSALSPAISHKFRTSLHGIMGFSELLLNKKAGKINKKQSEYLNDILTSANELVHLLDKGKKKPTTMRGKLYGR